MLLESVQCAHVRPDVLGQCLHQQAVIFPLMTRSGEAK